MARAKKSFYMGLTMINHGDLDKAEAALAEAARLDPQSYNTRLHLAKVYLKKKNPVKAIGQCRAAIKIDPKDRRAYSMLMGVYLDMGLAKQSIGVGEEALKSLGPGASRASVLVNLGWSYYVAGDLDNAQARFSEAGGLLKKKGPWITNDMGLVYFARGEYENALAEFREAGRMNPKGRLAPYFAALAESRLGDREGAKESLREGLKRDPKLPSKAAVYNAQFFPKADPGDLSGLFKELEREK